MPWGNAWSGGGEVVASSVEVVDNNQVVASINTQGVGTFSEIVDNGPLIAGGEDVLALIGAMPRGVIAWGQHTDGGTTWGTGVQGPVATASFVAEANRLYAIHAEGLELDASVNGAAILAEFHYATGGAIPTSSSPLTAGGKGNTPGKTTWGIASPNIDGWITFGATTQVCVGLFIGNLDGAAATVSTWAGYSPGWLLWVEDLGLSPTVNNGVQFNASPPPPQHQFNVIAAASVSYTGGGAASPGSGSPGQWMYYGEDPGDAVNGNWRSYCWFDGTPGILDMAGYVSVSQLDIFVYEDWFYQVAGGTLYIGFHNVVGIPGTEPGGSTYQQLAVNYSGRGQGQWISLLGVSSIMNAVHAGTIRGFVLGPGPTSSYNYYGYASGVNGPSPITLRATYYK